MEGVQAKKDWKKTEKNIQIKPVYTLSEWKNKKIDMHTC